MKTTELPIEHEETDSRMSKPRRQSDILGTPKRRPASARMTPIPIEWLDPDCWRLPSGKALAEFALQAGFLAPLLLSSARPKRVEASPASAESTESQIGSDGGQDGPKMGTEGHRHSGAGNGRK